MLTNHVVDMFGLPPMREYVSVCEDVFNDNLPGWAAEEHYDNCTGGASWLYQLPGQDNGKKELTKHI